MKSGEDWRALLSMTSGSKDKAPAPQKCLANVMTALKHCPEWSGVLRYNDFTNALEVAKALPKAKSQTETIDSGEWQELYALYAIAWLQERLGFEISVKLMDQVAELIGGESRYHPVRTWLGALRWDGKPRCGRMLADIFGARDDAVNAAVGSMWMISAVARVMSPGCQADHMMVLEGAQGTGKSTALRVLVGGEPWFQNSPIEMGNKDALISMRGCWVYEFDELDSFRGRDATRVKSFITQPVDTYRPVFGVRKRSFPRQVVFVGSTNEKQYLPDQTGNRRFWPVACGVIDVARLEREREQLWAEAYQRYCGGEAWHITDATLLGQVEESQAEREQPDPWQGPIEKWWHELMPYRQLEGVTTADVFRAIDLSLSRAERKEEMRAGACLRRMGLDRHRVGTRPRLYKYLPPPEWNIGRTCGGTEEPE